ncbi:MAG: zinc ABC transporter substrate-binding protein [Myxococcaceae bacterium]|nr:zinc ABC transporter substrate-binding protein [Myxococcaceae bacterium]
MTIPSLLALVVLSAAPAPLKVGVTLHPYYSWTSQVSLGLPIEVRAVLPGEVDAGDYQPTPEDVAKLKDLDALVVNGVGHDDFIEGMLKASGNTHVKIIRPNDGVALLKNAQGQVNAHTFISFSNAITQSYWVARELGALRPEWKQKLEENAAGYAKRLRALKADALQKLKPAQDKRVVTVHEGYSYLLQELGLTLVKVVEPAHGLLPSAAELGEVVALLKKEKITTVLSEARFPSPLLEVLKETGARVYVISHVATGAYTPEKFEREMKTNVDLLVRALVKDAR